jgi:hypothetical protein
MTKLYQGGGQQGESQPGSDELWNNITKI